MIPGFNKGVVSIAGIGREIGLTRERARQILKTHYGLDGKSAKRALALSKMKDSDRKRKQKIADALLTARYGATESEMTSRFGEGWRASLDAYSRAKAIANRKQIEWKIRYVDWLEVWASSDAKDGGRLCFVRQDNRFPFQKGNLRVVSMSGFAMEIRGRDARCYRFAEKMKKFEISENAQVARNNVSEL